MGSKGDYVDFPNNTLLQEVIRKSQMQKIRKRKAHVHNRKRLGMNPFGKIVRTLHFCPCKPYVSCFMRYVWTRVFGGLRTQTSMARKPEKDRVQTTFLILMSACVLVSLIANAVPQPHIKSRSAPQKCSLNTTLKT